LAQPVTEVGFGVGVGAATHPQRYMPIALQVPTEQFPTQAVTAVDQRQALYGVDVGLVVGLGVGVDVLNSQQT